RFALSARAQPGLASTIGLSGDSVVAAPGDRVRLPFTLLDRFGNVTGGVASLTALDTQVVAVIGSDSIEALRRGRARVAITAGDATDTVVIAVGQQVSKIVTDSVAVRLTTLGQSHLLSFRAVDDRARSISDSLPTLEIPSSLRVLAVTDSTVLVESVAPGAGHIIIGYGELQAAIAIEVRQVATSIALTSSAATLEALGDTCRLAIAMVDANGAAITDQIPAVTSSSAATVSIADAYNAVAMGEGDAYVVAVAESGVRDSVRLSVRQRPVRFGGTADSLVLASIGERRVALVAEDSRGNAIASARPGFDVSDSSVVQIDELGMVEARRNGRALLRASVAGIQDSVVVRVEQIARSIDVTPTQITFVALGDSVRLQATARDSLGVPLETQSVTIGAAGSDVVRTNASWIVATGDGDARVTLTADGAQSDVTVLVQRELRSVTIASADGAPIQRRLHQGPVTVACRALDANGFDMPRVGIAVTSRNGGVAGTRCDALRAVRSGVDTLVATAGTASDTAAIAIAIAPAVLDAQGVLVVADSFGTRNPHWASSAMKGPDGEVDLFYASYVREVGDSLSHADLHQLVSRDGGATFEYKGVALRHDPDDCDADGFAIENVAIAERAEGPGFRMFYASGSQCLGWRVRSAVSPDRVSWVKEPGVRIGEPGIFPNPYSAGEGMTVMRGPDAIGWRMWAGVYEPNEGFAIEEWRSPDQITWSRHRRVFSPLTFPGRPQRMVYSPSIVPIGPSMWRMFFCADDKHEPGGRSRLYSAVSRDLVSWEFESVVLDDPGYDFYYVSAVDANLYFIRAGADGIPWLAKSRVLQR
ncbi:MAG TPA: hypothetical protein VHM30_00610, partial [Gemmatimonadaceae bacterium]|nr:hypothetical protein [Gemmatimonadaceae bacterium]